jgi:3-oxoacyl-[acyl-carrier-protein] synthase II
VSDGRQAWVTGIGLLSAVGEGVGAHAALLTGGCDGAGVTDAFAPYPVHALCPVDFARQIPKSSEQRQMGTWQKTGVYAAGLALADAGLADKPDLLDRTDLICAAGNGERDLTLDHRVAEMLAAGGAGPGALNEALAKGLRPTLYLNELSNLLAGNIQIVHTVTGSSRTFKGEETAGVAAVEDAVGRIGAGQGDLFLVGGALNAERWDLLLGYELGRNLWSGPFASVWQRRDGGGGFIAGSIGAFLVIESRAHAQARGATPYARIGAIGADRSRRQPGDTRDALLLLFEAHCKDLAAGPLPVLSGASGVEPATAEELEFLLGLEGEGYHPAIRAYGSRLGHGVEAHFPLGIALAALAVKQGQFYRPEDSSGVEEAFDAPPERVLVTSVGHWRGEGLALVERVS